MRSQSMQGAFERRYILWAACGLTFYLIMHHAHTVHHVTVVTPCGMVSSVLRSKIASCAQPEWVNRYTSRKAVQHIHQLGTGIRAVSVFRYMPLHAQINVTMARPCAVVNCEHVLTHDAELVPMEEYTHEVCERLPHITVVEPFFSYCSRKACCSWLANLPLDIIEHFSISWYARSHIELTPHDAARMPGLKYIAWYMTFFSDDMTCAMERVAQPKKRVDLRVPPYIIVSPMLRGSL